MGGGKSWCILADNLKYIHDPNYFSVFFRRTTIELETNLWPEALKMYKPFLEYQSGPKKGKLLPGVRIRDKDKTIVWPSGAKTRFSYLQNERDALAWYGSEISRAYFDEAQMFGEEEFNIIRSRLRSKAKFPSAMRLTMNPSSSHFSLEFVRRFLDEEGYPIKDLSGKTAYFSIVNGNIYTAWTAEELLEKFPDINPQTYSYVPAVLSDNKILMETEPEYRDVLASMPEVKRKQLLEGCWFVQDTHGMYFDRTWLHKASSVPPGCKAVRGWDKASEEPNPNLRHPDYTASVLMYKDKHGNYYLCNGTRFRKKSGERDLMILNQAEHDGRDVSIIFPIDPGASGKSDFRHSTKMFLEEGFIVKRDPMPPTRPKLQKFEPFATAAQNGQVYLVESTWDPDTLKIYLDELESFNGERSSAQRKDDFVDCTASAFNQISREKVIPQFSLGEFSESPPTQMSALRNETGYYGKDS